MPLSESIFFNSIWLTKDFLTNRTLTFTTQGIKIQIFFTKTLVESVENLRWSVIKLILKSFRSKGNYKSYIVIITKFSNFIHINILVLFLLNEEKWDVLPLYIYEASILLNFMINIKPKKSYLFNSLIPEVFLMNMY